MSVEPDLSQVLPISPILAFDSEVKAFIAEENQKVVAAYKRARNSVTAEAIVGQMVDVTPSAEVVDDELPF
jgi:hypothetical protein